MENTSKSYLFISAEKAELGAYENLQRTTEMQDVLDSMGIKYQQVVGKYNGQTEESFMVQWSPNNELIVQRLAANFGQESYLVTDINRMGLLYDGNGKFIQRLGKYRTQTTAPDGDYTMINPEFYLTF